MIRTIAWAMALSVGAVGAATADCTAVGTDDFFDLDEAQVVAVYDCLKARMAEGYAKEGDAVGTAYRGWTVTSTRPAVAGPHGGRLLQTFANDVAAAQYLAFAEEGVEMPVGSVLAKESVSLSKKKMTARPGPLFIMTKVGSDAAPDTAGWLYAGVQPNGKPMKIKQSFCHDCHVGWEAQDHLAYPLEEVRVGAATN